MGIMIWRKVFFCKLSYRNQQLTDMYSFNAAIRASISSSVPIVILR